MIGGPVRDLWTVYRLQSLGVRLDLKGALLRPSTPLYEATARGLPGFGLWAGRVHTVALTLRGQRGFIQARQRSESPALDLLFIAPALDRRPGAAWLWQDLLHELVRVGGAAGIQRLFAHLPAERHAEVEVMRQAGFSIYAQDYLYRLERVRQVDAGPTHWVPRKSIDDWGLQRLYHAVTPAVVKQAEHRMDLTRLEGQRASWWGSGKKGSYVLRGESAGDVLGWLRLTRGERAHWLKLVLHPERASEAIPRLKEALSILSTWRALPVYCDVRDYEGFLNSALDDCGFERIMRRVLLVRQTTSHVRAEVPRLKPIEVTAETAPTPF